MSQGVSSASWAEHLIYMEAGGELPLSSPKSALAPGVWVCGALAFAAWGLQQAGAWTFGGRGLDAAMIAMLLGFAVGNLAGARGTALRPGARRVVAVVLPAGIVLLGARLQLQDVLGLGLRGLAASVAVVAASALVLWAVASRFGLSARLATLLAVGTGICGGSAVVATAPVIGADEDEVAVSVATMALLGLVSMLVLPMVAALIGMNGTDFGTWAGLAIQQTPQVVAAGFAFGPDAGEAATVVKLVRITLLAPVVVLIGVAYRARALRSRGGGAGRLRLRGLVPGFVLGLLLLAVFASLGLLPDVALSTGRDSVVGATGVQVSTQALAVAFSKVCLVVAMAAVGMETRWTSLRRTGPAALGAAACASAIIITASGAVLMLV